MRRGDLIQSSDASRRRRWAPRPRETKVLEPISWDSHAAASFRTAGMSGLAITGRLPRIKDYGHPWAMTNHTIAFAKRRLRSARTRSQPFIASVNAYWHTRRLRGQRRPYSPADSSPRGDDQSVGRLSCHSQPKWTRNALAVSEAHATNPTAPTNLLKGRRVSPQGLLNRLANSEYLLVWCSSSRAAFTSGEFQRSRTHSIVRLSIPRQRSSSRAR